jgi:hypothetical protein
MAIRVDTTTATKELTENRDVAPLLEADMPVLADSEMSVGVAPSAKSEKSSINSAMTEHVLETHL